MVRQWLYEDQLNPVAELDGAGNLLWQYVYASREHSPDFLVSDAGAVFRVISDQLGSPRLIVNIANSADVLLEAEYTAFGARTVVSGDPSGVNVGFAGGVFDVDTGLTRFGARDYDSVVGRWVSKDPSGLVSDGSNLFRYAHDDAVNGHDPTGLVTIPGDAGPGCMACTRACIKESEDWDCPNSAVPACEPQPALSCDQERENVYHDCFARKCDGPGKPCG